MTTHEKIEDQFSSYYDGELDEAATSKVEEHLASCEDCTRAYAAFRETVEAISGLAKVSAPAGFERDVETTLEKRSAGRFFAERKITDRLPLTVIALTAIAIGVIVYILMRGSETGSLKGGGEGPDKPVDREVIPKP